MPSPDPARRRPKDETTDFGKYWSDALKADPRYQQVEVEILKLYASARYRELPAEMALHLEVLAAMQAWEDIPSDYIPECCLRAMRKRDLPGNAAVLEEWRAITEQHRKSAPRETPVEEVLTEQDKAERQRVLDEIRRTLGLSL